MANGFGGNCSNTHSNLISQGYNLESDNDCGLHTTGDITNTNPLIGLLNIRPLGRLQTVALQRNSSAIDHGSNTGYPTTDPRGI